MGIKKKTIIMLFMCTLCFVTPIPSNAQSDHGLYWGVDEGQLLNYTLRASAEGEVVTYDLYYYVIDLPPIPTVVDGPEDISFAEVYVYDENFTYIPGLYLDYMGLFPTGLPTGNWPLVTQIFESAWEGLDDRRVSQTSSTWSIHQTGDNYFGTRTIRTHTYFSKIDGMLTKMVWESRSGLSVYLLTITRKGGSVSLLVPLAIAGVGVAVIVGIAVVLWKKRTPPKVYYSEIIG